MCTEGLTKPMSKKIKIHEPCSYKSQHIMPAYKGGRENTCYSRHKPSTQHKKAANHHQIHNTTPTNTSFQRFTITKIIIKHPCTNKKNRAVWLVCTPAKDPNWESSLKHADAGRIQTSDRHKSRTTK